MPPTERELFLAALKFQQPSRVPLMPGYGRESTLRTWRQQGLPAHVTDYFRYACEQLGIDIPHPAPLPGVNVDFRMIPQFEEKVLEHRRGDPARGVPGVLVVQDWKGNVCEISDQYDVTYLRTATDFVTRSWLKCPVESRADWEQMKTRYDLDAPGRWPADWRERGQALEAREFVAALVFPGPFWQLREWLGFENLCMLFLDDPAFVREMIGFWEDFVAGMLERLLTAHVPDIVVLNEDMAYKENPMIGPAMCREFLLPCWSRWTRLMHEAGVPIVEIDSDGYIGDLVPVWIEAGVDSNSPLEVAAGNDLPRMRQQYGKRMAWRGGVDKRAMAKGGPALAAEIARLQPVIDAGGYIPGCDHGIPADVSWPNYIEYVRLLAEATGWR